MERLIPASPAHVDHVGTWLHGTSALSACTVPPTIYSAIEVGLARRMLAQATSSRASTSVGDANIWHVAFDGVLDCSTRMARCTVCNRCKGTSKYQACTSTISFKSQVSNPSTLISGSLAAGHHPCPQLFHCGMLSPYALARRWSPCAGHHGHRGTNSQQIAGCFTRTGHFPVLPTPTGMTHSHLLCFLIVSHQSSVCMSITKGK